ncbi:hypothetical protein ACQ4M3_41810 [Leptolyngbya sp. AN03gr2]|uniref:hypothetical protein n=1 Tax=unclassified Leptolyngbya TaxID=2650499 RepID=UPI003D31A661
MANVDQANIDTTIGLLQEGVIAIPVEQAMEVIEAWEQQLRGLAIANDLGELKDALRKGKSAEAIANLLMSLGGDTSGELNIETSGDVADKIQQLSRLLTEASTDMRSLA